MNNKNFLKLIKLKKLNANNEIFILVLEIVF